MAEDFYASCKCNRGQDPFSAYPCTFLYREHNLSKFKDMEKDRKLITHLKYNPTNNEIIILDATRPRQRSNRFRPDSKRGRASVRSRANKPPKQLSERFIRSPVLITLLIPSKSVQVGNILTPSTSTLPTPWLHVRVE